MNKITEIRTAYNRKHEGTAIVITRTDGTARAYNYTEKSALAICHLIDIARKDWMTQYLPFRIIDTRK